MSTSDRSPTETNPQGATTVLAIVGLVLLAGAICWIAVLTYGIFADPTSVEDRAYGWAGAIVIAALALVASAISLVWSFQLQRPKPTE